MPSQKTNFTEAGRAVLRDEAAALSSLADSIGDAFDRVAELVFESPHHVVVSGAGKSGIIARKVAATLASTGTPALFLHAGDAAHGDLGAVVPGAVCLLLSYSGTTKEVLDLCAALRRFGCHIVAVTGNRSSELAKRSDLVLDIGVQKEAGAFGLAPTTSTTASLALGDALAIAVATARGFTDSDFARNHPGGHLGAMLLVRLSALVITGDDIPIVDIGAKVPEIIVEIMKKRLGMTLVTGPDGDVVGIVTDGDLRRGMARGASFFTASCRDVFTPDPVALHESELASRALRIMSERRITSIVVRRDQGGFGIITMHRLLDAGLSRPGTVRPPPSPEYAQEAVVAAPPRLPR